MGNKNFRLSWSNTEPLAGPSREVFSGILGTLCKGKEAPLARYSAQHERVLPKMCPWGGR